ncbi:hypothetical protein BWK59_09480 [Flavobacterium davisii]|uniref:Uncharacterized protein n=1 Tax=Flavobacterium davisii TaxID=2906077 RepID=A0A2D0AIF8_9FLAO|nr:hypothetical protein BWK59_09480 [Flavobacterium davisii]
MGQKTVRDASSFLSLLLNLDSSSRPKEGSHKVNNITRSKEARVERQEWRGKSGEAKGKRQ